SLIDVGQPETVREQRRQIELAAADHLDEAAHALFAAGAKRRHDAMVAETGGKRIVRDPQLAGVDAERRERPAGTKHAKRVLERLLGPERLDGHVDASAGQ